MKQRKIWKLPSEGEYSNLPSEMSNAQAEDREADANGMDITQQPEIKEYQETDADGIEVTLQPEVLLEAEISAEAHSSEEGPENHEIQNELIPEMDVSLDAENLELSTEESNAQAGYETDAN